MAGKQISLLIENTDGDYSTMSLQAMLVTQKVNRPFIRFTSFNKIFTNKQHIVYTINSHFSILMSPIKISKTENL